MAKPNRSTNTNSNSNSTETREFFINIGTVVDVNGKSLFCTAFGTSFNLGDKSTLSGELGNCTNALRDLIYATCEDLEPGQGKIISEDVFSIQVFRRDLNKEQTSSTSVSNTDKFANMLALLKNK